MVSISGRRPKTIPPLGDDLIRLLAFSLVGLLAHCLALVIQGEPSLLSLRFALIAGAAPAAAISALRFVGNADELMR
ncbi:MAG: hypothetical protein ACLQDM_01690 [Bradyrhizobium sp.]